MMVVLWNTTLSADPILPMHQFLWIGMAEASLQSVSVQWTIGWTFVPRKSSIFVLFLHLSLDLDIVPFSQGATLKIDQ
jgi:hypothetical protein